MFSSHRQRDLRATVPQRPSLRLASSAEHHARITARLTARDRWVARLLAEHRVLSSPQITQAAFGSRSAANQRLQRLYTWRICDRFQPYIGRGRAPMCYVLDTTGAHLLAHADGLNPAELKFRPDRSIGIAHSLRLAHLLGVNEFFTSLIAAARTETPTRALTAWWPETRAARHFGDHVRPDAYGRWREHDREIEWFLEWDTGSYQLSRLTAKLPGYAALAATTGIITPLLIVFAGPIREVHARRGFTEHLRTSARPHDVPIATTTVTDLQAADSPAAAIWLPLNAREPDRRRLIDLPAAWPHVDPPTSSETTEPAEAATSPTPRLAPPEPMPPYTTAELSWNPR